MFIKYFKNCIEAMPKGGDLYFTLVPDHKHIQLYIKDTGVGMDSEQVKRLGSPFYSTKEKRYWTWNDGRIRCCSSYEWKN